MKLAIHHRPGSFSERWITYCEREKIEYKKVNCFDSDIVEQLKDCDALFWHHHHAIYEDVLVAKQILFALEHAGKRVFPDFRTSWHFDDKVAQKYLLKAIGAPLVPSYVYYDKKEALHWAKSTYFPKVFKLKGGAGSINVKLVKSQSDCVKLINRAFGKGFSQFDRFGNLKEQVRRYREGKGSLLNVIKGIGRLFIPTNFAKMYAREKGYVYFQEFIPENEFDIRVIVIGDKSFALKRMIRKNDFRASGSGNIIYDKNQIDIECIKIAFEVNKKIQSQSIAYDFIFDKNMRPLLVEISYGFDVSAYDFCPGYWDSKLNWYEGNFNPQEWMMHELIKKLEKNNVNEFY
jgi:glutathione synthase/RimK-type ligase-like ATP-grasp enzyme